MTEPAADLHPTMPEPMAALPQDTLQADDTSQLSGRSHFSAWAARLTVADGVVALTVLIAAIMRFNNLGQPPLSPAEATAALSSWQFGQAGATVGLVPSPAYFTLTNIAMLVLGSSDIIARFIPALLGTLTVGLVLAVRRTWLPAGIVAVAVFLALSPLNVLASRTAGGQAIAVFALLLLVVSGVRLLSGGGKGWAYSLGIALGLGFTSDPLFVGGFVALVPCWLWLGSRQSDAGSPMAFGRLGSTWRTIAVAFGVSFILLSTSFLLYLPGLGSAFGIITAWLSAFGLPTLSLAPGGLAALFLTTLRYEPALFLLGIPALVSALTGRFGLALLMAGWWVLLIVIAIFQPAAGNALLFTVPGYLLIGLLARGLSLESGGDRSVTLAVAGGLVLLGMILLVSMARYTRLALWSSDQLAFLVLALVAFVAAGGLLVLAMSYSSVAARQGAFLGIAFLMLYFQAGSAEYLAQSGANDPRERVILEGADNGMHDFSQVVVDVSRQITGADHDLEINSTVDSPILRWYLREFEHAQFGSALPFSANPQALITPIDADLQIGDDYLGADFGLRNYRAEAITPFVLNDALKWLLFHESAAPINSEKIILWVRSDLTGAGGQ